MPFLSILPGYLITRSFVLWLPFSLPYASSVSQDFPFFHAKDGTQCVVLFLKNMGSLLVFDCLMFSFSEMRLVPVLWCCC
jgi:hypothetical protein